MEYIFVVVMKVWKEKDEKDRYSDRVWGYTTPIAKVWDKPNVWVDIVVPNVAHDPLFFQPKRQSKTIEYLCRMGRQCRPIRRVFVFFNLKTF
jgi:hypothetical protein